MEEAETTTTTTTIPAVRGALGWHWTRLPIQTAIDYFGASRNAGTLPVTDTVGHFLNASKTELEFLAEFSAYGKEFIFPTGFVHEVVRLMTSGAVGASALECACSGGADVEGCPHADAGNCLGLTGGAWQRIVPRMWR